MKDTEFWLEFKIFLQGYKFLCKNPLLRNVNERVDYPVRNLQLKYMLESKF